MGRKLQPAACAVCLVFLGACTGGTEQVVNEPITSVAAKLVAMPQASDATRFALQVAESAVYVAPQSEPDGESLVWHFTQRGRDYCRFYAELRQDGAAKTRVRTHSELASDAADAIVAEGGKRPDHTYLCNMARLAGEESVSATLQGRPVDNEAMLRRIRVAVAANPLAVGRTAADAMDDAARMMKADNAARGDASRTAAMDAANQAREQELRSKPSVPVGNYSGAHR